MDFPNPHYRWCKPDLFTALHRAEAEMRLTGVTHEHVRIVSRILLFSAVHAGMRFEPPSMQTVDALGICLRLLNPRGEEYLSALSLLAEDVTVKFLQRLETEDEFLEVQAETEIRGTSLWDYLGRHTPRCNQFEMLLRRIKKRSTPQYRQVERLCEAARDEAAAVMLNRDDRVNPAMMKLMLIAVEHCLTHDRAAEARSIKNGMAPLSMRYRGIFVPPAVPQLDLVGQVEASVSVLLNMTTEEWAEHTGILRLPPDELIKLCRAPLPEPE